MPTGRIIFRVVQEGVMPIEVISAARLSAKKPKYLKKPRNPRFITMLKVSTTLRSMPQEASQAVFRPKN